MTIKLGSKVRDTVTGFTGIATSSHTYMNGCVRISVAPPVDKEGKMPQSEAFDIQQLEVIEEPKVEPVQASTTKAPGGDRPLNVPHR